VAPRPSRVTSLEGFGVWVGQAAQTQVGRRVGLSVTDRESLRRLFDLRF
jgi:hypothetical protein